MGWRSRSGVALVMVSLVAGCGGPAATPGSSGVIPGSPAASAAAGGSLAGTLPAGSPGSQASPGATSAIAPGSAGPGVATGPIDPTTVLPLIAATPDVKVLGASSADLGAQTWARVNAQAVYGQAATDLQALYDSTAATALQKLQSKLTSAAIPADAVVPAVVPAAWRAPGVGGTVAGQSAMLSIAWMFMLIFGNTIVGSYDPRKGDQPAQSFSTSETASKNGMTMQIDITASGSVSGSVVTASITVAGAGSGTDAKSGKPVALTGSSTFAFTINPCPDAGGLVNGTVDITDDDTVSGGGGPTLGFKVKGHTDYITTVGDDAQVASTKVTAKWDESVSRATPDPNGGAPTVNQGEIAMSASETFSGSGSVDQSAESASVDSQTGDMTNEDAILVGKTMGLFGLVTPIVLSQAASDVWRGGKCFEIRPAPDGGSVTTGSTTPVKIVVWHWVDKAEVHLPVRATLSGAKSIDPAGQPVMSPGTFTFTAGQPLSTGAVAFKVTSKRGIAEKTSTFKVRGDLRLAISGTLVETVTSVIGIRYDLRIAGTGLVVTANPDGSVEVSGDVTVKGTVTTGAVPCAGTINEKIPVKGMGSVAGPADAPVYRVLIGPAKTSNLGGTVSCAGVITVHSNEGDFFGQWSATLGYVDLPAAGGVVRKSNVTSGLPTRDAKGTFTATLP